jgi:hypothetical protein
MGFKKGPVAEFRGESDVDAFHEQSLARAVMEGKADYRGEFVRA